MHSDTSNPGLRHRLPFYPGQFLIAMATVSLGPLLDPMMKDLSIPLSQGGLINSTLFIGTALGIVLFNAAQAHLPTKWCFTGATALLGASLILAGTVARNLWAVCIAYSAVGLAAAMILTTGFVWLAAHVKKNMASSVLMLTLFFGLAMISIPPLVGHALDNGATWRQIILVEGGVSLCAALIFVFLPLLDIPERRNIGLAHLRAVIAHNRGLLLAMLAGGFAYTGAEFIFNVWLPKSQIEVFGSSGTMASLALTLFWAGEATGRLLFVPLAKRVSAARLLLVCSCVMGAFAIALAVAPSATAALALAAGGGLAASPCYALIASYSDRFPGWQSGVASSLFILSGAIGGMVFPYLIGPLAASAGFRVALAMAAVPALVCSGLSLVLHAKGERSIVGL